MPRTKYYQPKKSKRTKHYLKGKKKKDGKMTKVVKEKNRWIKFYNRLALKVGNPPFKYYNYSLLKIKRATAKMYMTYIQLTHLDRINKNKYRGRNTHDRI